MDGRVAPFGRDIAFMARREFSSQSKIPNCHLSRYYRLWAKSHSEDNFSTPKTVRKKGSSY